MKKGNKEKGNLTSTGKARWQGEGGGSEWRGARAD